MRPHAAIAAATFTLALVGGVALVLAPSSEPETKLGRARGARASHEAAQAPALAAREASVAPRLAPPATPRGLSSASGRLDDVRAAGASSAAGEHAGRNVFAASDAARRAAASHATGSSSATEGADAELARKAAQVERVRAGLRSPDAQARLDALRAARDLHAPELEGDAAAELATDPAASCRRVAAQILALGDSASHDEALRGALHDADPIVQMNAAFGLARAGDEGQQAVLLLQCEAAREKSPALVPYLATMLEDPTLRSPAVLERFRVLSQDPAVAPEARARAAQVLKAKGA